MSAIFLCYRRDDAAGYVHAIRDRLADRLDPDQVFMDIDSIEPGLDFEEVIERSVASCSVLLALIGKRWSPEKLQDSRDFVRLEIQTALEKKIRVIPVLLDGAEMPKPEALPAELAPLSRRQAYEVSNRRFSHDAEGLADQVEKILREQKPKKSPPPKPKSPPPKPKKSPPPRPLSRRQAYEVSNRGFSDDADELPDWVPPSPKSLVLKADPLGETPSETPAPVWLKRFGWGRKLVYLLGILYTLVYLAATLVGTFEEYSGQPHLDIDRTIQDLDVIIMDLDRILRWLLYPSSALLLLGWALRIRRSSKAWICFMVAGVWQLFVPAIVKFLEPRLLTFLAGMSFESVLVGALIFCVLTVQLMKEVGEW